MAEEKVCTLEIQAPFHFTIQALGTCSKISGRKSFNFDTGTVIITINHKKLQPRGVGPRIKAGMSAIELAQNH